MSKTQVVTAVRDKIEKLYTHTCKIYEEKSKRDPVTKTTKMVKEIIYTDLPCRVSYLAQEVASLEFVDESSSKVKLFVQPDISIPEGSKVEVMAEGVTTIYSNSSPPFIYATHREYILDYIKEVN